MPEANPIVISHQVELGPELTNEVMDEARRQGENPDTCHLRIQELRDMIYGEFGSLLGLDTKTEARVIVETMTGVKFLTFHKKSGK